MEDFATALETFEQEQAQTEAALNDEQIVTGTVLKITPQYVVVDIGYKSEGVVPVAEFTDSEGNVSVQPGEEIPVVRDQGHTEEGYINLSYHKAQRLKAWDEIEKAYNDKAAVKARIIDRIKGGLTVDILGARAFLPGSQVDLRPVRNLDVLKGTDLEVRIIKLNKKRGNIVASRKQLLEEEQGEKRTKTLEQLSEDSILTGTVKNLTNYGAFVDLGGIDGLLHITDMSWGRLTHPRDLVQVGDQIQVKVLKFDREKQRVSLGFKQLTPDPWLDASERYPIGAHVHGRVISVTDYGAFIELEQGIEGLVHVSEMTWSKRMKHPSKLVNVGDEVDAVVLNVNPTERRISLGLKQLESNPWESLIEKFPVGAIVEGKVRNLTDFGAFIEIEEGIDGLVHVSNLSWTKRVKHPSEVLKKGDKVKAIVLAIEPDQRRLSLGVKQLQPDVWETFFDQHRVGDPGSSGSRCLFGIVLLGVADADRGPQSARPSLDLGEVGPGDRAAPGRPDRAALHPLVGGRVAVCRPGGGEACRDHAQLPRRGERPRGGGALGVLGHDEFLRLLVRPVPARDQAAGTRRDDHVAIFRVPAEREETEAIDREGRGHFEGCVVDQPDGIPIAGPDVHVGLTSGDLGRAGSELSATGGADQDLDRERALGAGRDSRRGDVGARLLDALPDRTLTLFAQGFQRDDHRGPDQAGDRREVVDVHAVLAQESAAVLVDHATVDPDHGVPPDRVFVLAIIAVDLQPCAVLHEDLALLQLALERLANPRRGVGG